MKVVMIAACTADGFIGRTGSQSSMSWTSPEDKKLFVDLTRQLKVMVMGARSFATFNRGLPGRHIYVYTRQPENLRGISGVSPTAKAPAELLQELAGKGHEAVAVCGGSVVYGQYMQANLVDEIFLTVEPVLFGQGIPLFDQGLDVRLQLLTSRPLNGNTILQHYRVLRPEAAPEDLA